MYDEMTLHALLNGHFFSKNQETSLHCWLLRGWKADNQCFSILSPIISYDYLVRETASSVQINKYYFFTSSFLLMPPLEGPLEGPH